MHNHVVSNNSCLWWCNIKSFLILKTFRSFWDALLSFLLWGYSIDLLRRNPLQDQWERLCLVHSGVGVWWYWGRVGGCVIQSLTSTGLPSSTRVVISVRPRMSVASRSSNCLRSISLQSRKMETMLVCTATPSVCHCRSNRACRSRLLKVWCRLFFSKPKEENSTTFLAPSTTTDTCAGVEAVVQTPQMSYKVRWTLAMWKKTTFPIF